MPYPSDECDARLFLNLHPQLGPVRIARMVEHFGSALAALGAPEAAWRNWEDGPALRRWLAASAPGWEDEKRRAARGGARVICALDAEYPEGFRRLHDAPPVLYMWGSLQPNDSRGVAVVGSRTPTAYGRLAAQRLARRLAEAGVTVISGLARGVDGAAHTGALAGGGRSVAILGSGLARLYPAEHRGLAKRLAGRGAVLSEFAMEAPPAGVHFPRRNRLLAALGLGVVVVEAAERSGALITATLAADMGRDVFAVPGSIFSDLSRGPHRLIKAGAIPVENAQDVLSALGLAGAALPCAGPAPGGGNTPSLRGLLEYVTDEPVHIDDLVRRSGLSPAETARELLTLEMAGRVRAWPGGRYARADTL